jgi:transcriptional antiterminator RfaH
MAAAERASEQMAEDWFLVQFKPNSHKVADRNLKRQGFKTFLPLQLITRRHNDRFVSESRPLFPGYMFIRLEPETSPWRKVNSTYGVSRIVSFRDTPSPVPDGLVAALLARCDSDGRVQSATGMSTGDRVTVIDGPFAEFVGTIETIDAEKRVWLLLDFMGQSTRIQVHPNQITGR